MKMCWSDSRCISPIEYVLTDPRTGKYNSKTMFNIKRDSKGRIIEYNRIVNKRKVLCIRDNFDEFDRHRYYRQEQIIAGTYYEQYIEYYDELSSNIFGKRKVYQKTVLLYKIKYYSKVFEKDQIDKAKINREISEKVYNECIEEYKKKQYLIDIRLKELASDESVKKAVMNSDIIDRKVDKKHATKRDKTITDDQPIVIKKDEDLTDTEILNKVFKKNPRTKAIYKLTFKTNKDDADEFRQKLVNLYRSGDVIKAYNIDKYDVNTL